MHWYLPYLLMYFSGFISCQFSIAILATYLFRNTNSPGIGGGVKGGGGVNEINDEKKLYCIVLI